MDEKKQWPDASEWLLTVPLYREIEFDPEQAWDVLNLKYFKETIDSYCIECKKASTFRGANPVIPTNLVFKPSVPGKKPNLPPINRETFEVTLECTRDTRHHQHKYFLVKPPKYELIRKMVDASGRPVATQKKIIKNGSFQKIGQYPSYGDLQIPNLKNYSKVLSKKDQSEFVRAAGLASHDVGVGSYVYLRRVFESLIEEAHDLAKNDTNWDDEEYVKSRMSEKIKLLKDYLPEFLVNNPEMYSLLSKGVHEMTEDECLHHFDTLKIGIELILDEKLEQKKKEDKIKKAEKKLQRAIEDTK